MTHFLGVTRSLVLELLPQPLAICRLPHDAPVPRWGRGGAVAAAIRSESSLTLMVPSSQVPAEILAGPDASDGWRALRIAGEFAFSEVGVLVSVAAPLAAAGVSILPLATYETDFVLLREAQLALARTTLRDAGHVVHDVRDMPR